MRQTSHVFFNAGGVRLSGHLTSPGGPGPCPALALAHGFTGIKAFCDEFVEALVTAGEE